jgi:hypothetical protein
MSPIFGFDIPELLKKNECNNSSDNPLQTSVIYKNDIFVNLLLQLEMKRMAGR